MGKEQWQLALALATPLATLTIVMVGFLYNNSRLSDLRNEISNRLSDFRGEMNSRFNDMNTRFNDMNGRFNDRFSYMSVRFDDAKEVNDANLRRMEDMLLGKFAELDTRLSRIESHLNMH